jgi:putative hydrolase of HD superfamily
MIARLESQLSFLAEADKLKEVLRQGLTTGSRRRENSAEHSWHLALFLLALAEHASEPLNQAHAIRLVLIHDLVEIDAGDVFFYDDAGQAAKMENERLAADRIFSLLPPDQGRELRALWDEFEFGTTPEAKAARAMDRLQAMLQNLRTEGAAWRKHGIVKAQVLERNRPIAEAFPGIWAWMTGELDRAEAAGYFKPSTSCIE